LDKYNVPVKYNVSAIEHNVSVALNGSAGRNLYQQNDYF
jgi:hypothetical protein